MDPAGVILTNNHVVSGEGEVTVRLFDGREYRATSVKTDPKTDLAIVKIHGAKNLTAAPLGNSEEMQVGDWVLALGQPFGLEGTVTAGNSSGITDGAAALILMDSDLARERGIEPLAYLGETRAAGVDPKVMGIGPVPAVRALQAVNGLAVSDYDLIELNEAFAAQVLACDRELHLPLDRLNVNGGSIALGHPIGATGARIVVTLLHELARRGGEHGLATLCISGGMGLATAFHRSPR
ncbi:MAG TPA: trypsin-like peptidase domain-containing protein [Planctomycetota bacterium]|nr:trypsin-like peptidase domain-containing protein [Planctomycetota bacterium]